MANGIVEIVLPEIPTTVEELFTLVGVSALPNERRNRVAIKSTLQYDSPMVSITFYNEDKESILSAITLGVDLYEGVTIGITLPVDDYAGKSMLTAAYDLQGNLLQVNVYDYEGMQIIEVEAMSVLFPSAAKQLNKLDPVSTFASNLTGTNEEMVLIRKN